EFKSFQSNQSNWQGLEACLYCIRSIARKVESDETSIIPSVMEILPQISKVNNEIKYTATLIVGRYSNWISENSKYLPGLISFVVSGLGDTNTAAASALAFKHLCDGCANLLSESYWAPLLQVYNKSNQLCLQDQLEIIEGCAIVASTMPPDT